MKSRTEPVAGDVRRVEQVVCGVREEESAGAPVEVERVAGFQGREQSIVKRAAQIAATDLPLRRVEQHHRLCTFTHWLYMSMIIKDLVRMRCTFN